MCEPLHIEATLFLRGHAGRSGPLYVIRATAVTRAYRNTQNVRRFLQSECGAEFKFDRPFMQWIKDGTEKTMG
jgi:Domain of unknown function (DUF6434)